MVKVGYGNWFGRVDHRLALQGLQEREPNFREDDLAGPGWHHDEHRVQLADERPGNPESGGPWQLARQLIEMYEAPDPSIIRGLYAAGSALNGRDILLEGRFHGLHFSMGVRVTQVIDETRNNGTRVWGWAYETLQGHVERGRMSYEVVKHLDTGRVEFVTHGVSQRAPTVGPLLRLGWTLFGRRTQLRFYRRCGDRVRRIVSESLEGRHPVPRPVVIDGLVHAPSDATPRIRDRFALGSQHPG